MKHVLALFLCCLFFTSPACGAQGPESSITMLQKAIDTMDPDLLEKYLDVEGLTQKGAAMAVEDPALLKRASQYPALALMIAGLSGGARDGLIQLLAHETRSLVRYGVASGAFAGKPGTGENPGDPGLMAPLLKGDERDRKKFGAVKILEKSDNYSRVATSLYDGVSKKSYPLELTLELSEDVWQVRKIVNLADLLRMADK